MQMGDWQLIYKSSEEESKASNYQNQEKTGFDRLLEELEVKYHLVDEFEHRNST